MRVGIRCLVLKNRTFVGHKSSLYIPSPFLSYNLKLLCSIVVERGNIQLVTILHIPLQFTPWPSQVLPVVPDILPNVIRTVSHLLLVSYGAQQQVEQENHVSQHVFTYFWLLLLVGLCILNWGKEQECILNYSDAAISLALLTINLRFESRFWLSILGLNRAFDYQS